MSLTLFSDLEEAVAWLQRTRADYSSGCARPPRLPTIQAQLETAFQGLTQRVASQLLAGRPSAQSNLTQHGCY